MNTLFELASVIPSRHDDETEWEYRSRIKTLAESFSISEDERVAAEAVAEGARSSRYQQRVDALPLDLRKLYDLQMAAATNGMVYDPCVSVEFENARGGGVPITRLTATLNIDTFQPDVPANLRLEMQGSSYGGITVPVRSMADVRAVLAKIRDFADQLDKVSR